MIPLAITILLCLGFATAITMAAYLHFAGKIPEKEEPEDLE